MNGAAAPRGRRWWKFAALAVLLVAAAIWALSHFGIQGLVIPVRVGSGSMAPALLGPHFEITCEDCDFSWSFDALQEINFDRLVCPNCGKVHARDVRQLERRRGERVILDHWTYLWHLPQRGDIAVYRRTQPTTHLEVKRIVGLPGEHVAFRHGDVYVNGRMLKKSLQELREVAMVVHDNHYRPRDKELSARWRPEPTDDDQPQWISYRAWRCFDSPRPRTEETVVLDNDGYNQGLRRETHEVYDLLLQFRVRARAPASISLRGHNGWAEYKLDAQLDSGRAVLYREGQQVAEGELPRNLAVLNGRWEFAMVDGQVMFSIRGTNVLTWDDPAAAEGNQPRQAQPRPLAFATQGAHVEIDGLRVLRDLHYLSPRGLKDTWSGVQLGPDEYLLLGDNVPISQDGRLEGRGISRKSIVGRALKKPG